MLIRGARTSATTASGRRFSALSISHALYDGWSLGMVHRDVDAAYNSRYSARDSYTRFLTGVISSATPSAERFWSGYLDSVAPTIFPARADADSLGEDTVHRNEIMSSLSLSDVKDFCRRQSVSIQVVGQACWSAILLPKPNLWISLLASFFSTVGRRTRKISSSPP